MSREGKYISMVLKEEDHRRAKIVAAKTGKTLKQIFLEAVTALEAKVKKEEENKNSI